MYRDKAELLIKALRSGEYKQGTGRLRDDDNKFCCLGVACDLYMKHTGKGQWVTDDIGLHTFYTFHIDESSSGTVLPVDVMEWFGMSTDSGHYGVTSLVLDNDGNHEPPKSFSEIADIIERNADKL